MRAARVFWRMEAVQGVLFAALMLSAHIVLTSPVIERSRYARACKMCPAGEYQKSCDECEPCPAGTYTSEPNYEDSCLSCFRDCRPDFHLQVVEKCTSKSNLKCTCEIGFTCSDIDPHTNYCRECAKIPKMTTTVKPTAAPLLIFRNLISSILTTSRPCRHPDCASNLVTPAGNATDPVPAKTMREQATILSPLVALGVLAFVILFCYHHPEGELCFKRAILNSFNKMGKDASSHAMESTYHNPRDPSGAKHQPCSLAATNLGPVHVHNTGTVVFSLLSQFTGQADPAREEEKRGETENNAEEERDCPVFHPTPSPCAHLSEEEKNGESVFFPFQEQGKDSHMSKEEML
ncbi:uncharacterized protein si:dkey-260g12.1 [Lampris incognitus]|uniref:uncharacterized protein si:dkey-260g12.1 n=1 Tax=Lampris incognitus TaxID=2546036 RepID=UPI0024B486CB|nr:uncharacterized protein si:dkey-260g12.1 [Lampris incognitus]